MQHAVELPAQHCTYTGLPPCLLMWWPLQAEPACLCNSSCNMTRTGVREPLELTSFSGFMCTMTRGKPSMHPRSALERNPSQCRFSNLLRCSRSLAFFPMHNVLQRATPTLNGVAIWRLNRAAFASLGEVS